jgi:hypothetical protein
MTKAPVEPRRSASLSVADQVNGVFPMCTNG